MWSAPILDRSTPLRLKGRGRARARWTTLDWAASLTLSAFWHLMVLAVLALAVHPFQLPDLERSISLELLPPLTPPPTPTVQLDLRPREQEPPPPPAPKVGRVQPEAAQPEVAQPEVAQPEPVQPEAQVLPRTLEVKPQRTAPAPLLAPKAAPPIPQEAPPEPVTVARPAPVLRPQVEAPRVQAPSRVGPLDTAKAPTIPKAAPAAPESAAPEVLTNQRVIQAPVEIRPREHAPLNTGVEPEGGAPAIPGGPAQGPAGAVAPGAGGGGAKPGAGPIDGINGGYGLKGLRSTLGCENPDTYKLTAEERAACLQRFAERAKGAPELGPNISAAKLAEFDRIAACRRATVSREVPAYNSATPGNRLISGLGDTPSLRDCPPGDR